jgi:hypothetical protein
VLGFSTPSDSGFDQTYPFHARSYERFPGLSFFDSQDDDCQSIEKRKERPGRERASSSSRSLLTPLLKSTNQQHPCAFFCGARPISRLAPKGQSLLTGRSPDWVPWQLQPDCPKNRHLCTYPLILWSRQNTTSSEGTIVWTLVQQFFIDEQTTSRSWI